MVSEVVHNGDPVYLCFDLQPALNAAESGKRLGNRCRSNAVMRCQGRGGGRVPDVVFSGQRELEIGPRLAVAQYRPRRPLGLELHVRDSPCGRLASAVAFDWAERFRQAALDALAGVETDDASTAGPEGYTALAGG